MVEAGRHASAEGAAQTKTNKKLTMKRLRAMTEWYIFTFASVKRLRDACHNPVVEPISPAATEDTTKRIHHIQSVTIVWMTIETAVSLSAAWRARSPALLAFGGDSAIELVSAVVVLWRFRPSAQDSAEKRAALIAGALLLALAAYVIAVSVLTLLSYSEPRRTYLGMAVLIAAAAIMPWLAREKRRLSAITGSAALRADAAESSLCAYLSFIALAGLGVNAFWHITWADPIAALAAVPLIVWEGRQAMLGKSCRCC
jgi:divalent metal cation (Fe/Co/Zn/Cd) transporter